MSHSEQTKIWRIDNELLISYTSHSESFVVLTESSKNSTYCRWISSWRRVLSSSIIMITEAINCDTKVMSKLLKTGIQNTANPEREASKIPNSFVLRPEERSWMKCRVSGSLLFWATWQRSPAVCVPLLPAIWGYEQPS